MALEVRNGNTYYYRKIRIGKRVISEYVAKGELAFLLYQYDQIEREEIEIQITERKDYLEKISKVDVDLVNLEKEIKSIIEKSFVAIGFHKTTSRQWRIRIIMNNLEIPKSIDIDRQETVFNVLDATNKNNPTEKAKKDLENVFNEYPDVWEKCGNIAERVKDSILITSLQSNHLLIEATKRKLLSMRDSLGWQISSEMERLLIEQICLTWFRLNILETVHAETFNQANSIARKEHLDKLLTQAQKRYLRASESLIRVRKLLAEAELKQQQARNKRSKSVAITNKLLKDLTA
jgi:hypothetical protein